MVEKKEMPKRETGFEILRIISIFLICCVHVLNYGGLLKNGGDTIPFLNIIYAFFTPSVNVFVLISGYFLVEKTFQRKKILSLWIKVFVYTLALYLFTAFVIEKDFSWTWFVSCFFPIITKKYWFFTSYFVIYLLFPYLNKILNSCTKKELICLRVGIYLFVVLATRFKIAEVASIENGYSIFWFILLYLLGGSIHKAPSKLSKWYFLMGYFVGLLLLWGFTFVDSSKGIWKYLYCNMEYVSPLVLFNSVFLIYLFKGITNIPILLHNIICFISKSVFGIYLFQESAFKKTLYSSILSVQNYYGSRYSFWYVLLLGLIIFGIGFVFDLIYRGIRFLSLKFLIQPIVKKRLNRKEEIA